VTSRERKDDNLISGSPRDRFLVAGTHPIQIRHGWQVFAKTGGGWSKLPRINLPAP
jgi:hypothetical protein